MYTYICPIGYCMDNIDFCKSVVNCIAVQLVRHCISSICQTVHTEAANILTRRCTCQTQHFHILEMPPIFSGLEVFTEQQAITELVICKHLTHIKEPVTQTYWFVCSH